VNDFLPKGYATPEVPSNYMEFEEGQNYFRALSGAIVGYQWWVENGEGRKPIRVRTLEEVPEEFRNAANNRENARHFWAFTVYNYQAKALQVLVLKQQTIMRAIEAFSKNPKWGNPKNYDLVVEKTRTGSRERDVEYSVIPEPPTPLDPAIEELAGNVPVRLEALYEGADPFATDEGGDAGAKAGRARRQR
jgi:hypothetical protein